MAYRRMRWEAAADKRHAVNTAEANGEVADSLDVRMKLMQRVEAGEITLAQAQDELKKIKRSAKKNGLSTRSQVWNRS